MTLEKDENALKFGNDDVQNENSGDVIVEIEKILDKRYDSIHEESKASSKPIVAESV